MNDRRTIRMIAVMVVLCAAARTSLAEVVFEEDFASGTLESWHVKEGKWAVGDGQAVAGAGFSRLMYGGDEWQDLQLTADVTYTHDEAHAPAGVLFRFREDMTGYFACLRDVEKGAHPEFGAWERPVVQLLRLDGDGWKVLQESKVLGCRSGVSRRLKVICKGASIWVFYEDMTTPVIAEYDATYDRKGSVGLCKHPAGTGTFDNVSVSMVGAVPPEPLRTDWSGVRGAVYVRSDAVNSVQMWHDYWDHTETIDRELSYAALYGFNMAQVYLHWIVWDRHREEYLARIDDFLGRAAKHGLAVNLILWDDCGHVEPSLTFADPVPGRHNSQMMPNPSHRIRDDTELFDAHRERFQEYVEGVAGRFKDDRRIAFWQLYNEAMGPKEQYRTSAGDHNIERLLGWTRDWVKKTGTTIPVTATGGAFYGPKYSDFYTYHSYVGGDHPLPGGDGGPEHLCTETLNRPGSTLFTCLQDLAAKQQGFVVWELMIGRDNCRYPWGNPDGTQEPAQPFHGMIYPDGHPCDVAEIKALLGDKAFDALQAGVFKVEYFAGHFETSKKISIAPRIDFDLGDEHGTGSPDSSAGIDKDDFSIRWTGKLTVPVDDKYTFHAQCDGLLRLEIDGKTVLDKTAHGDREVKADVDLRAGTASEVRVEYYHRSGAASSHVFWSGPGFAKRPLLLGARGQAGTAALNVE